MTCLPLPSSVHDYLAPVRGMCLDLEGEAPIPAAAPNPRPRPITINELLAAWAQAKMGYGDNTLLPGPGRRLVLTLQDIETRQIRFAVVHLWQLAVIEGEPSNIDLTDCEAATARLARYGWLRPATMGTCPRRSGT